LKFKRQKKNEKRILRGTAQKTVNEREKSLEGILRERKHFSKKKDVFDVV